MSTGVHKEVNLQRFVVDHLINHGWLTSKGNEGYDKERALFVPDLLGWFKETDPDNYHRIVPQDGPEAAIAKGQNRILDRVAKKISCRGKTRRWNTQRLTPRSRRGGGKEVQPAADAPSQR